LIGCGGGGSDDGTSTGSSATTSATGGNGSTTGPSQFTVEQRSQATGRIAEQYGTLLDAGDPNAMQTLSHWVLTQPEFKASGAGDGVLWAEFKDGRYFMFVDNWQDVPPPAPASAFSRGRSGAPEVPSGKSALMLKLLAEEFEPGDASFQKTSQALTDHGYNVAAPKTLTVENLQTAGDWGVVYLNSHAGLYGPDDNKRYAVVTETSATEANDAKFADDISNGRLIYTRTWNWWRKFRDSKPPHYAVTDQFMDRYVQLGDNFLCVLMMCNGGSNESAQFRTSLTKQKQGSIIGWAGNANANGYLTVDLLFDRMFGQNDVEKTDPPNRAFTFSDVWDFIVRRGLNVNQGTGAAIKVFGTGFGIGGPVISGLKPEWKDKLTIFGSFGTRPGSVTIGGVPAKSVDTWTPTEIRVSLATGPNDPPGSCGDVIVTAAGRTSNARTLTSWRGDVLVKFQYLPFDDVTDSRQFTVTYKLHLRGDAHELRERVDGPLHNGEFYVFPASDTTVTFSASGRQVQPQGDDPPYITAWSGSGAFTIAGTDFDQNKEATMYVYIDVKNRRLIAIPMWSLEGLIRVDETDQPVFMHPVLPRPDLYEIYNPSGNFVDVTKPVFGFNIPMAADFSIPAGQKSKTAVDDPERQTVSWTAMTPTPAYNDKIGRGR
jgi:hypothetical protein